MFKTGLKNIKEYYLPYFYVGVFILTILVLFIPNILIVLKIILVLTGAILFSVFFGTVFMLSNMFIRPRINNFILKKKKYKKIEKLGIQFDGTDEYHGIYRGFYVQLLYSYSKDKIFTSDYYLQIIYDEVNVEKFKKIKRKLIFKDMFLFKNIMQTIFSFKIFPPKEEKIIKKMNKMIDFLIENNFMPVRIEELSHIFEPFEQNNDKHK